MHDETQDKDKNLENYFDAKQREDIPKKITEGYVQGVLQRLEVQPAAWKIVVLPVLGFALGAVFVMALWQPWKDPVVVTPAPSLPAIELDATILDQVSPADLPPIPTEDLLPQVEMLDTFTVAMESKDDRNTLGIEDEMKVLTAIGAGSNTSPHLTEQDFELLDEMETATDNA